MYYTGSKVSIKPEAWERYCKEEGVNKPLPPPQIITHAPNHPPFDEKFMLSFPFYWWNEDDIIFL